MNMHKRTQIFTRQVQVDLLALSDAELLRVIQLWLYGEPSRTPHEIAGETLLALGYTLKVAEAHGQVVDLAVAQAGEANAEWIAPLPQHLRSLLAEMDVKRFEQYVLPLAYETLHLTHPEWGEGSTFNAHLANQLRSIGTKR